MGVKEPMAEEAYEKVPFLQRRQIAFLGVLCIVCGIFVISTCCVALLAEKPTSRSDTKELVVEFTPLNEQQLQTLYDRFEITADQVLPGVVDSGSAQRFKTTLGHLIKLKDFLKKEAIEYTIVQ